MTDGSYDNVASSASGMDRALDAGGGIIRFAPTWVPRAYSTPGRRIRLHPDDYYPFGQDRGGIDERWLASAVHADNGPGTGEHEGLSLVVDPDGGLIPFDAFVDHHGAQLLGSRIWDQHHKWPMYSKFFDNLAALPFHLHQQDQHAALVDKPGKPEAYYYSPHMNNHLGTQPITFMGLKPSVTTEQLKEKLMLFRRGGDNNITHLAPGYRTELGTGWDVPAGVLHAPASVCTYEPQVATDIFSMWETWSNNREVPEELLWKDSPASKVGDFDWLIELLNWELNVDPDYAANRFLRPYSTKRSLADGEVGYVEKWVVFKSHQFSAKELTVRPDQTVTITDGDAYGIIVVQGNGTFGDHNIAASTLIRYGQLTEDEFFVSERAAREGVTIKNHSATSDLVILKHFGPENAELRTA